MDAITERANRQDIPADTCIAITPAGGVDIVIIGGSDIDLVKFNGKIFWRTSVGVSYVVCIK